MEGRELCISSMTWGELQSGVARLPESKRRSELLLWLQQLEINFDGRIFAFTQEVAAVWALMTVQASLRGKSISAFDSIIAATARSHGCRLVTQNASDFSESGVEVLNPWEFGND
jgi:predicted nucleic acid-binding protein